VFLDEIGFLLQPFRQRTWAPRGQTPVLKVSAKHNRRVSAIGGLALSPTGRRSTLYFALTQDSFKTPEVIAFLKQLHGQLRRKIIIVWDRLNAHRSAATWFQKHRPGWFEFEFLPPYSPELNPVEQCWSHTKCRSLANLCPTSTTELEPIVAATLKARRHERRLHAAWFQHAGLPLDSPP
jgi:transposase